MVGASLTMISLVCLWVVAQLVLFGALAQDRDQRLLYDEFRGQLAAGLAPLGAEAPPGRPVALLRVPRLELQQVVVEGTASGDLLAGPGHRRDTVLPGQAGVSVVYARGATYGAPFAHLGDLRAGDAVTVVTGQGELALTVVGVRREGDPMLAPPAAGTARLTLVTAEGSGRLADFRPTTTLYVDAEAEEGFVAPPRSVSGVPDSERAMAAEPGALPVLVLFLTVLVALTVAVSLARQRWPGPLVWVVVSPVGIAVAWMTTDVVMRLLPNLI